MDAPLCRLCEKRHYGTCAGAVVPAKPRVRKKSAGPKKKSRGAQAHVEIQAQVSGVEELLARVESLEARVLELESRKRYMREYQRAKRAEEK